MADQLTALPPIKLTSLRVRADALDAIVMAPAGVRVSADAARRADAAFPKLVDHVCVSNGSTHFGDEIVGTEPAHLVEHIAIELMVQTAALDERERKANNASEDVPARTYTGHTSPVNRLDSDDPSFDPYQVSITYDNDIMAIRALRYACDIASWVLKADEDAQNGVVVNIPSFAGVLRDLLALYRK